MDAFDEVRFPDDIAEGAEGGRQFQTLVVDVSSGDENRTPQWEAGRLRWTVGQVLRSTTQASQLKAFFCARRGRLQGFRFKDWQDYQAEGEELDHGGQTVVQLTKTYTSGGVDYIRKITKPVPDSVSFQLNGSPWGDPVVDNTTGLVTLSGGLSGTDVLMWAGEFDIPVRFDTDNMQLVQEEARIRAWQPISIVELPESEVLGT